MSGVLEVLPMTCQNCRHVTDRTTCGHPASPGAGDEEVDLYSPPPVDCPLRSDKEQR
jgi:hypothetical protein